MEAIEKMSHVQHLKPFSLPIPESWIQASVFPDAVRLLESQILLNGILEEMPIRAFHKCVFQEMAVILTYRLRINK